MHSNRRIIRLFALALVATPLAASAAESTPPPAPSGTRNENLTALLRDVENGVFFLRVLDAGGKPISMATGFLVNDKGSMLTSLHVMRPTTALASSAEAVGVDGKTHAVNAITTSGVWFSLRGGDRRDAGIYHWYFLWETKTGEAVVPERVKAINRFAAARWSGGDKIMSKDATAAEEQHYVFLAELKNRLEEPILTVSRNALEKEARARFDRFRTADRRGAQKGLKASDARGLIDGQRSALFSTALKTGAVAHMEQ